MSLLQWIQAASRLLWGPGTLVLLTGTGLFLLIRTRFLPWRNLGWALKSVLGRDSRAKAGGVGDVSPFSALMTTPLKSMEETIAALHAAKLDCKVMVGGAALTPEYAEKIGADWYAKDAKRSADIAKEFFGAQ